MLSGTIRIIKKADGKMLDYIGVLYLMPRRHYWLIFRERNCSYRQRLLDHITQIDQDTQRRGIWSPDEV